LVEGGEQQGARAGAEIEDRPRPLVAEMGERGLDQGLAVGARHHIQARQPLRLVLGGQGADQLVQLAFEDLGQAVEGEVDAVVGHPPCGKL
jgi:hypothetical protein